MPPIYTMPEMVGIVIELFVLFMGYAVLTIIILKINGVTLKEFYKKYEDKSQTDEEGEKWELTRGKVAVMVFLIFIAICIYSTMN